RFVAPHQSLGGQRQQQPAGGVLVQIGGPRDLGQRQHRLRHRKAAQDRRNTFYRPHFLRGTGGGIQRAVGFDHGNVSPVDTANSPIDLERSIRSFWVREKTETTKGEGRF